MASDLNMFGALLGMTEIIGRFHPLLVHLPIGFLALLASLELLALRPRFEHHRAVSRAILGLTVPVALSSALTGWVLAASGDYDPQLLTWHRWFGVSVAAAVPLLLALHWRGRLRAYRRSLGVTLLLVVITGHWGGSLTHGRDFISFSALAPRPQRSGDASTTSNVNRLTLPVYTAAIQPIFNRYCISCHGPEKTKAKLRLDSYDYLSKGSENGPVLEPCASASSVLIKRLLLPADEDDHMPPKGKPQTTPDDLALLRWWIDAGAPTTQSAAELDAPEPIQRLLAPHPVQAGLKPPSPAKTDGL